MVTSSMIFGLIILHFKSQGRNGDMDTSIQIRSLPGIR